MQSYKFFRNIACEYFPCHTSNDINCLFCYCPLYFIECGGNFKYNGHKDCSKCVVVHEQGGHEYVLEVLRHHHKHAVELNTPWVGIDFDGTLVKMLPPGEWNINNYGEPLQPMVDHIKKLIAEGTRVKIFTARASHPAGMIAVRQALMSMELPPLEITCVKDMNCMQLIDDIATFVERDKGILGPCNADISDRWKK